MADEDWKDWVRKHELLHEQRDAVMQDILSYVQEIPQIRADVDTLKTDVAILKGDVAVLKGDVAVLKSDVAVLKADMNDVKHLLARHDEDIAHLKVASHTH